MSNTIIINKKINSYKKTIVVGSDKSISIRTILLASQALGVSTISNLLESEDVLNALNAIKKLGIKYKKKGNKYKIYGLGLNGFKLNQNTTINAGNSGTLARLILGLLVKSDQKIKLIGDKSLSKRDFSRVTNPLKQFGVNIKSTKNSLPLEIRGTEFLRPINFIENIGSAQCKSAVMLAALNTPGKTFIKAKKSRNHTELLFKFLKIPMKLKEGKNYDDIQITGQSFFDCFKYSVPSDISSSAFFIVLTILSSKSEITIKNVNINKSRIGIIKILKMMNCNIAFKNIQNYHGEKIADINVKSSRNIRSINCPSKLNSSAIDEFLVIFLVAAKAKGVSKFSNLEELNKKESPRLNIAINILKMMGIKVIKKKNNIKIYGNQKLELQGKYNIKNYMKDHRVAMTSIIAALVFGGSWKINDINSINTSFPSFIKLIKNLGAKIN